MSGLRRSLALLSPRLVLFADGRIAFFQFIQFFIRKIFNIDHVIVRGAVRTDQLVEFKVNGFGVTVLRILDEEDNQKSEHAGAGIDDKLPGIGIVENWSADSPHHQRKDCAQKHHGMSHQPRGFAGEATEPEAHGIGLSDLLTGLSQWRLLIQLRLRRGLRRLALRFCVASIHTSLDADSP